MPSDFTPNEPFARLHLVGSELSFPMLGDVQNFLYDINFLYEILRLAIDPNYEGFKFSHNAFFRNGRPLKPEDRLHIESLKLTSPIDIHIVINLNMALATGTVAGAATLISILAYADKIADLMNLPLVRRKLKAEVEKLERENAEAALRGEDADRALETTKETVRVRGAEYYADVAGRRLRQSPVKLETVDVEIVTERTRHREPEDGQ
jgi:hypothetical protein